MPAFFVPLLDLPHASVVKANQAARHIAVFACRANNICRPCSDIVVVVDRAFHLIVSKRHETRRIFFARPADQIFRHIREPSVVTAVD